MGIGFIELCRHFSEKAVNIYFSDEMSALFHDIKLITQEQSVFSNDFIYIGKTSMLQGEAKNLKNASLVLINDNSLSIEDFFINKLNVIEYKGTEDIFETCNQIRELFLEDVQLEHRKSALLKSFITGNGLDYIVNVASQTLNNPVVVIDISYKVLAYSSSMDMNDPVWMENIKKGYCSYDFIMAVKKMKSVQYGLKSGEPYEVVCKESPVPKLVSRIKIRGKYMGNVILLGCKQPFLPKDRELLALASDIIAEEMKKNSFYRNAYNVVYDDLVYDLLENNLRSRKVLEERMKSGNIRFGKRLSVFVLDISKYNSSGKNSGYLKDKFSALFSYNNLVYYNDMVVSIQDNEKLDMNSEFIQKARDLLIPNRIYLGISKEFSDIAECRKYYFQAVKAIEIGKIVCPENPLIFYSDIQLYDLLSSSHTPMDYKDFCHPVLITLREYDKKNHSDLYNTLFVYLKNNQSIQKTSEELFIHRNTMWYRMQKILDLVHVDFSNIENVLTLYMSYKITGYLDKIKARKVGKGSKDFQAIIQP